MTIRAAATRAVIGLAGLALSASVMGAPVRAADPSPCRVLDVEHGVTVHGLQRAVYGAAAGGHLVVRGTCTGRASISKDLTVTGSTLVGAQPVLLRKPGTHGWVVRVADGARVQLAGLTVLGAPEPPTWIGPGTAVRVERATAILHDVEIANDRRGILMMDGVLRLAGGTDIHDNHGDEGLGVFVAQGVLVMSGTSRIHDNHGVMIHSGKLSSGGGVELSEGRLVMRDDARIDSNVATYGGGVIALGGSIRMLGNARIDHNGYDGILIPFGAAVVLEGVVCTPGEGQNVSDNDPLQVHDEEDGSRDC